jgi:hypothetical protein
MPPRSTVVTAALILGVVAGGFFLVSTFSLGEADSWASVTSGMTSLISFIFAAADRLLSPVKRVVDVVPPEAGGGVTSALHPVPPPSGAQQDASLLGGVASRFIQAYEWHGVTRAEIPDFLADFEGPPVKLRDLASDERLLDRLDAPLLDFTTAVFDLHPDWLRREDATQVLRDHDFYKHVNAFPDFLLVRSSSRSGRDRLWHSGFGDGLDARLTMVSTSEPELPDSDSTTDAVGPYVGAVYQVQIGTFRGRQVWRYHPLVPFDWGYWRTRYQLIAMMALADECGVTVLGQFVGSDDEVQDICRGRRFPYEVTHRAGPMNWWPKYPFLGSHAWQDDPDYLGRWKPYLDYIRDEGYRDDLAEARQERRRALRRPRSDDED